MNTYWADTRSVGWTAAGLLGIATLLTWLTVTGPFIGSLNVKGIDTDDGRLALGLALVLGVIAVFANRMWLGICGVLALAFHGYEYVHLARFDVVNTGHPEFEQALARAFTFSPGLGIYLGLLTGLALAGWGLVVPSVHKRKTVEVPAEAPPGSPSE